MESRGRDSPTDAYTWRRKAVSPASTSRASPRAGQITSYGYLFEDVQGALEIGIDEPLHTRCVEQLQLEGPDPSYGIAVARGVVKGL